MGKANARLRRVMAEIDRLEKLYKTSRAFFPYLKDTVEGCHTLEPPPYYRRQKDYIPIIIIFPKGMTGNNITRLNEVGKFQSENAIIRLCALLEIEEVIPWGPLPSADEKLPCGKDIWTLKEWLTESCTRQQPLKKKPEKKI